MDMIKNEWKAIKSNRLMLITFIGMLFIPLLYAGFFLKSVWDPYGKTDNLPVAVVNLDESVTFEGNKLDVGNELVKELKKNTSLDWNFVSAKEAQAGMDDQKYYMVLTIPKDFSANAATLLDNQPKKMELRYETNDSLNYIGAQIDKTAAGKVQNQVSESVTTAYLNAITSQFSTLKSGLVQAADGSNKLADGTEQLQSGNEQITSNLQKLAAGSLTFSDGINSLSVGLSQYMGGVQQVDQGVTTLNSGVRQLSGQLPTLSTGVQALNSGAQQLQQGVTKYTQGVDTLQQSSAKAAAGYSNAGSELSSKGGQLADAVHTMNTTLTGSLTQSADQLGTLATSLHQLSDLSNGIQANLAGGSGAAAATAQTTTVSGDSTQVRAAIDELNTEQFLNLSPEEQAAVLADVRGKLSQAADAIDTPQTVTVNQPATTAVSADVQAQMAQLSGGLQAVAAKTDQTVGALQQGNTQIASQLKQLDESSRAFANGVTAYTSGSADAFNGIAAGAQQLSDNGQALNNGAAGVASGTQQLGEKTPALMAGVSQLQNGTQTLQNGTNELVSKNGQLSSGTSQLVNGVGTLSSGSTQLAEGSQTLGSGIATLQSGTTELADKLTEGSKAASEANLGKSVIKQIAAPTTLKHAEYSKVPNYGHALAPYVLSLALFMGCIVFNYIYPIRKVSMNGKSATAWWASKVTVGLVAAIGMGLIESGAMLLLGLQVDHLGEYFAISLMAAISFMFLVMFLSMLLDNIGRFIAVILLVLQLAGSGGTFPMQTTGPFFNAIHPYLPMSHSILGLRQAITSGFGNSVFADNFMFLLILALGSLICLLLSMIYLQKIHRAGSSKLDDNQLLQGLLNVPE